MEEIGSDRYLQEVTRLVCANDPITFINDWCWTFDPRGSPSQLPFVLFPHQEACIAWIQERERNQQNGVIEKSRDSGITYICAAYSAWCWLFRDGDSTGFGSRKEELVDRIGDPDSILEKVRIILRNLPTWFLPEGFRFGQHDGFRKIINPANGSTITGEAGDDIGRGGRKSRYFVDEKAFIERTQKVDAALSQNTRVQIDISTPNGVGNTFYKRRHSGNIPVFTFHWKDDPRKSEEWYESEKKRIDDPVIVAQELDIDYTASLEGICIPAKFAQAGINLFDTPQFKAAYPDWKPMGERVAGLDIAEEGSNKSVFISRVSSLIESIVSWGQCNTTETAHRAREEAVTRGVNVVNYDVVGVGAGVKGTWQSAEKQLPFKANPINWGLPASDDLWEDGKIGKELFVNLRAELAWKLRKRFERAYEFVHEGVLHPPEDMISIPNNRDLISDLSLELYFRTETGKTQLESKKDMQKRGVKSPDWKDALAFSFANGQRYTGKIS